MLKYNFAYDENHQLVNIADVPVEGHLDRHFTCVGCGMQMVAAIGPKRRYFRHNVDYDNCCNETYLHNLAKLQIKQRFDNRSFPFIVHLDSHAICSYRNNCSYYSEQRCEDFSKCVNIDLHQYYDTCSIEVPVYDQNQNRYVADLLLTHSKYPKRPPVLIEVFVNHECEIKKAESGLKIIEVKIQSETDVDRIFPEITLEDFEDDEFYYEPAIRYYGFRTQTIESDYVFNSSATLFTWRFVLYPSGKFFNPRVNCHDLSKKFNPSSQVELNITNGTSLDAYYYLAKKGISFKSCGICKYFKSRYDMDYCALHGKFQTPQFPSLSDAINCQYFRVTQEMPDVWRAGETIIEEVQ